MSNRPGLPETRSACDHVVVARVSKDAVQLSFGRRLYATCRALVPHLSDDERDLAAAGLAFYILLSVAPLAVVAVQLAAAFFDPLQVREVLAEDLGRATGRQVSEILNQLMTAQQERQSSAATIVSFSVLLWAAMRLFHRLQAALNMTWGVKADPDLHTREAIRLMIKKRVISFLMVLGSGVALIVSLVIKAVIAFISTPIDWVVRGDTIGPRIEQLEEYVLSFVLLTALVAALFRILPDVRVKWRDVWVGAAMTSILLALGMAAFSLYVALVGATQLAGAIGSIAVLMLWAYYTSHVLLIGALFTRLWADGGVLQPHPISLSADLRDKPNDQRDSRDSQQALN